MTVFTAMILAALFLEDDHFVGTRLVNHFAKDSRFFNGGGTHCRCLAFFAEHQHCADLDNITDFAGKFLNDKCIVFGNPVLFATAYYYCEHDRL